MIRLDEEPVSKAGRGKTLLGSSPNVSAYDPIVNWTSHDFPKVEGQVRFLLGLLLQRFKMKNKWLKPKMILNELKVIEAPDDIWLTRLRRDHFVWAVKEKRFMKVEWAFEPPEPGCIAGRMGLKFCWKNDQDQWGTEHCQTWFVKENGKGLDDKLLLKPVKDNCPDEPSPISEPWQRHVERQMSVLSHKVEQLESQVNFLEASRSAWRY